MIEAKGAVLTYAHACAHRRTHADKNSSGTYPALPPLLTSPPLTVLPGAHPSPLLSGGDLCSLPLQRLPQREVTSLSC